MNEIKIDILNNKHHLEHFDCGNEDLNNFLKEDALNNQIDRLSVTRILLLDDILAGYYTITPDTLHKESIMRQ